MNAMLDKQREKKVDELFRAFETVTDGSYLYVCDVKYDYSRWSADAISRFDLPGEYMFHAGQLWERLLHPDDRESYSESIAAIFPARIRGMTCSTGSRIVRDGMWYAPAGAPS